MNKEMTVAMLASAENKLLFVSDILLITTVLILMFANIFPAVDWLKWVAIGMFFVTAIIRIVVMYIQSKINRITKMDK